MTPENTLKEFIQRMNAWEIWAHKNSPKNPTHDEYDKFNKELNHRPQQIYADLCTPKDRPYGRQGMYQNPPEYQMTEEIIKVIECSERRIEIITQELEGFQNKNKYVLLKKQNRWLIDNKKWFDQIDN